MLPLDSDQVPLAPNWSDAVGLVLGLFMLASVVIFIGLHLFRLGKGNKTALQATVGLTVCIVTLFAIWNGTVKDTVISDASGRTQSCNPMPMSPMANALIPNDYFGRPLDPDWYTCRTKARKTIGGAVTLWILCAGLTVYGRKPRQQNSGNKNWPPRNREGQL